MPFFKALQLVWFVCFFISSKEKREVHSSSWSLKYLPANWKYVCMIENVSENDEAVTYFFLNMHTATNNKGNKHGNSHVAVTGT